MKIPEDLLKDLNINLYNEVIWKPHDKIRGKRTYICNNRHFLLTFWFTWWARYGVKFFSQQIHKNVLKEVDLDPSKFGIKTIIMTEDYELINLSSEITEFLVYSSSFIKSPNVSIK